MGADQAQDVQDRLRSGRREIPLAEDARLRRIIRALIGAQAPRLRTHLRVRLRAEEFLPSSAGGADAFPRASSGRLPHAASSGGRSLVWPFSLRYRKWGSSPQRVADFAEKAPGSVHGRFDRNRPQPSYSLPAAARMALASNFSPLMLSMHSTRSNRSCVPSAAVPPCARNVELRALVSRPAKVVPGAAAGAVGSGVGTADSAPRGIVSRSAGARDRDDDADPEREQYRPARRVRADTVAQAVAPDVYPRVNHPDGNVDPG